MIAFAANSVLARLALGAGDMSAAGYTGVMLITATPALTPERADAALRIVYKTLTGVCGLPVLGPCPDGAAIGPSDYIALRDMAGAALRLLRGYHLG